MSYSISLIAVPYFNALFLAGFISVYSFVFYERTRTTSLFSALSSSMSIWIFGSLFQILANEIELMIFWEYFRFVGINLASVFFLLYALSFTSLAPKLFSVLEF
ncbi:MAG: histidine kinase N-terminal 7TM domain-containing protein [Candidatus Hodarchaeales archaeon]